MYHYQKEGNWYYSTINAANMSYDRGGFLTRIDYGQRWNERAVPGWSRLAFTVTDRCKGIDPCVTPLEYPDVPTDLECTSGGTCKPNQSFFTKKALLSVAARTRPSGSPTYTTIDTLKLTYAFPDTDDTGSPHLWLDSLTRNGSGGGTSIDLPSTKFGGTGGNLANRLVVGPNQTALKMYRLGQIDTPLGAHINVGYFEPDPCSAAATPHPGNNTLNCFPVPEADDPDGFGWFHKYLVQTVTTTGVAIGTDGASKAVYTYGGASLDGITGNERGAWHYDESPDTPEDALAYNVWRGYDRVTVATGPASTGDRTTNNTSVDVYKMFRGMDGDSGDGDPVKSVTLTDDDGNAKDDADWLAGVTFEHQRFSGATEKERVTYGTDVVDGRTAGSGPATSRMVVQPKVLRTENPGAADETSSLTLTNFTPSWGLPATVREFGGPGSGDDRCTETQYAVNSSDGEWHAVVSQTTVHDGAGIADGAPATCSGARIARTDTYYDEHATLSAAPAAGLPTKVLQYSSGSETLTTVSHYDLFGRVTYLRDPRGAETNTDYVPDFAVGDVEHHPGGLIDQTIMTNELGPQTTLYLANRHIPWKTVDVNGNATSAEFDALGRVIAAHLPGNDYSDLDASVEYEYTVSKAEPSFVHTKALLRYSTAGDGVYTHNYAYVDGLGRARETQRTGPGVEGTEGAGGRIVTDTRYDARGRVSAVSAPMFMTGTAGSDFGNPIRSHIPSDTRTTYDALGRVLTTGLYHNDVAVTGHSTSLTYGADSVTTTPTVGMPTTTYTDAYGRTAAIDEKFNPIGSPWETTYDYDLLNNLTRITDAAGNHTTYTYDQLSRRLTTDDPDAGESTTTYDDADNTVTTTDGEGTTWAAYDVLGRQVDLRETGEHGAELATWTYDATGYLGLLAAASSYIDGAPYTITNTDYDNRDQLTKKTYSIPTAAGAVHGTYVFTYDYDEAGHRTIVHSPAVADLPAETITTAYSIRGYETSLVGDRGGSVSTYVASTTYTGNGDLDSRGYGGTGALTRHYDYDEPTRSLTNITSRFGPSAPFQNTAITQDNVGNVTSVETNAGGPSASDASLNECFTYDNANRLETAETKTGGGCTGPLATGAGTYHDNYEYDHVGNLIKRRDTQAGYGIYTEYLYGEDAGPHALTSTIDHVWDDDCGVDCRRAGRSEPGDTPGGVGTDSPPGHDVPSVVGELTYDDDGRRTTKTDDDGETDYDWDARHHLTATDVPRGSGTTPGTYGYDASGNRLIRNDDGARTLYLDSIEVATNHSGGGLAATRYYSTGGGVLVGMRKGDSAWTRALLNHQGSIQYLIPNGGTDTSTDIEYAPYGDTRSDVAGTATDRRYLHSPRDDTTGLIQLGARYYDAALKTFLTPDPIFNRARPNTLNPYSYALANPTTYTDPSGLYVDDGLCGGCGEEVSAPVQDQDYILGYPLPEDGPSAGDLAGIILKNDIVSKYHDEWGIPNSEPLLGLDTVVLLQWTCDSYRDVCGQDLIDQLFGDQMNYVAQSMGTWASPALTVAAGIAQDYELQGLKSAVARTEAESAKLAKFSGILQQAIKEKRNYSLGAGSRADADILGEAWVGSGARWSNSGTALVSADGLRQYRPPAYKSQSGLTQANLEWRIAPYGRFISDGHWKVTS